MNSIKTKIKSFWQKARLAWSFFDLFNKILQGFLKKNSRNTKDLDRKLVYDLSSSKIPSGQQIKHLKRFLSSREVLIIRICAVIILLNIVYLGVGFIKNHLQYYPTNGGKYIEGVVGYPQTINPLYAVNPGIDSDLSRLIYSSLFTYDGNGELSNDLVSSVAANASSTEYIIKIKKNVKWQDGGDLTASDIIFTLHLIQNPDYNSPLRPALVGVVATEINSNTIKFVLPKPYAPFLDLLTFGILPKKLWENIGPRAAIISDLNLRPIGSGPFKFKSLVKNSNGDLKDYYLTVNTNYYRKIPYLKTIDFKFFPVYQEAIGALNDNQIMGLGYLPFSLRGNLLARDSLNFHELVQAKIVALFFNYSKNKELSNRNVRVALATALNKKQMIKEIFSGIYQIDNGPILSENYAYNSEITKYNYSPKSAATIIKNKPLTLVLSVVDSGSDVMLAEKIKNYWQQVGVQVILKIIPSAQVMNVIKNRDFQVLLYGESVGGDPDVYAFWDSSQIGPQGLNLSDYNNPVVNKLLVSARSTANLSDRIEQYKKFQKIITHDLPAIFLYSPSYTYVQTSSLRGFSGTMIIEPADRFSSVSNWYLNTKSRFKW